MVELPQRQRLEALNAMNWKTLDIFSPQQH